VLLLPRPRLLLNCHPLPLSFLTPYLSKTSNHSISDFFLLTREGTTRLSTVASKLQLLALRGVTTSRSAQRARGLALRKTPKMIHAQSVLALHDLLLWRGTSTETCILCLRTAALLRSLAFKLTGRGDVVPLRDESILLTSFYVRKRVLQARLRIYLVTSSGLRTGESEVASFRYLRRSTRTGNPPALYTVLKYFGVW